MNTTKGARYTLPGQHSLSVRYIADNENLGFIQLWLFIALFIAFLLLPLIENLGY